MLHNILFSGLFLEHERQTIKEQSKESNQVEKSGMETFR